MNDRKVRGLVLFVAVILLLAGSLLFFIFDKQGMTKNKNGNYISYNVDDYVEIMPLIFCDYFDVYNKIDVSKINIKNLSSELIQEFENEQRQVIEYITLYYKQIKSKDIYSNINTVISTTKAQVNGTILSIYHRIDFDLDSNIFVNTNKNYVIICNIDLRTNKILTNDDLLSKYNYSKEYIAEKFFIEDILINNGQIVIAKDTNISLTRKDIERKKDDYIKRIIEEFDDIVTTYVDNGSLVLTYDKKDLKSIFFDNEFDTQIRERYLK